MAIWYTLWSFGILCGHLEYFMAIWYTYLLCGHFGIFSGLFFGMLYREKSGNPARDESIIAQLILPADRALGRIRN
jgi:hypothetical protein